MTFLQIIIFLISALLDRIGANLQIKLAHSLYPDEIYGGFGVPNRILKRIKAEHKADKLVMRKLKQARIIKVVGWLMLAVFVLLFFTSDPSKTI